MKKNKNLIIKLVSLGILILLYIFLYKLYIPRVNAFGCFDDCGNYISGYFMLHGKQLYSQIFFNHDPFMPYLSYILQYFIHPQNIYELVLRHRQLLLVSSFIFNALLIYRFGVAVLGFSIFFELTKFYVFGDRFLGESFIVYPIIYLIGLTFLKIEKKNLKHMDYYLSAIFTWFIIFTREPYVPIAVILFLYILLSRNKLKLTLISALIFMILTLVTLNFLNIKEFYYDVVSTNYVTSFSAEAKATNLFGIGLFNIFFYPLEILISGKAGYFKEILLLLDTPFLISIILLTLRHKFKLIVTSILILGILNVRFIEPGTTFYAAYHMLCWYGAMIFISFMILKHLFKYYKKSFFFILIFYVFILVFHLFNPLSFIQSKPDPYQEYITNYGQQIQVGTVVKDLSKPTDTLFLDGFDDIIYWQAKRYSDYPYSTYTADMPYFKKFIDARIEMFKNNPPDFYYGSCPKETDPSRMLPSFIKSQYSMLYNDGKPSCLFVKNSTLSKISKNKWRLAAKNLYTYK